MNVAEKEKQQQRHAERANYLGVYPQRNDQIEHLDVREVEHHTDG